MNISIIKTIAALGLGVLVSACTAAPDFPTRAAPFETTPIPTVAPVAAAPVAAMPVSLNVAEINVLVPESLEVSEANRFYPRGDIVWRGDPLGDRHAQVKAIFDTAFARGAESFDGETPVRLDVEVRRFHSLTEKTRYTVGGVHSITFLLTLRDARTGELLRPTREVQADLDGFGGRQAILADARGETQKVRITAHLAEVLRQELSRPEGHRNAKLGLIQALNKF